MDLLQLHATLSGAESTGALRVALQRYLAHGPAPAAARALEEAVSETPFAQQVRAHLAQGLGPSGEREYQLNLDDPACVTTWLKRRTRSANAHDAVLGVACHVEAAGRHGADFYLLQPIERAVQVACELARQQPQAEFELVRMPDDPDELAAKCRLRAGG
jgi:hypothetical protein